MLGVLGLILIVVGILGLLLHVGELAIDIVVALVGVVLLFVGGGAGVIGRRL